MAGLGRRHLLTGVGSVAAVATLTVAARAWSALPLGVVATPETAEQGALQAALDHVAPRAGRRSRIALGTSVARLAAEGVIDVAKVDALYAQRGDGESAGEMPSFGPQHHGVKALAPELRQALRWPSAQPMQVDRETAGFFLMALWPIGLANRMAANDDSPIQGDMLDRFASTSGWTLGNEANGAVYFNRYPIVDLTAEQEALAVDVAKTVYRPCCNNSTFFQDCNHGSAMLGLLQLGAAQGLTKTELYEEALLFNAYWFADRYAKTALFFRLFEGQPWGEVDPAVATSYTYSAVTPWELNVEKRLAQVRDLLPLVADQGGCSL